MIKLERSNLQAFCRTCLQRLEATSDTSPTYGIRETPNLMKLLILCTTLNINEDADEVFPQLLCTKCYQTLQEFQRFRDMALQSNEVLRELVENEDGLLIAPSKANALQEKYTIEIKSEAPTDGELVDTFKAEETELTSSFYVYDIEEPIIPNASSINTKNNSIETCDDENTASSDAQNRDAIFEEASTSAHAIKRKRVDGNDSEVQAKKRTIPEELIIIYLGVLAKRAKLLERRRMLKHLRDTNDPFSMEESEFIRTFRFPRSLCRELIQELEPHDDRKSVLPFAIRFLSVLYFYSHGSYQNSVGNNYTIPLSQASVSRSLELISRLLVNVKGREIIFPQSETELEAAKTKIFQIHDIQGTIGAIGCTHIAIATPAANDVNNPQQLYFNSEGFYSIYVQAVCDHRFRFTHMNAKFPGSCNDSDIWTTSSLRIHLIKTHNLQKDTWLLGDLRYPLEPWLLTPVTKPTNQKEHAFNELHAKAHSSIELAFGILKSRFKCLSSNHRTLHYSHEKAANITYACAILHNILIKNQISYDTEEVSRQLTRLKKRKQIKNTTNSDYCKEGQIIRSRFIDSLPESLLP